MVWLFYLIFPYIIGNVIIPTDYIAHTICFRGVAQHAQPPTSYEPPKKSAWFDGIWANPIKKSHNRAINPGWAKSTTSWPPWLQQGYPHHPAVKGADGLGFPLDKLGSTRTNGLSHVFCSGIYYNIDVENYPLICIYIYIDDLPIMLAFD